MLVGNRVIYSIAICFFLVFCFFGIAGAETTDTTTAFCDTCHASYSPPPSESTTSSLSCNTCHTSGSTLPAVNPIPFDQYHLSSEVTIPFDPAHVASLDTCGECHAAGTSSTQTSLGTAAGIPPDSAHYTTVAGTCNDCHSSDPAESTSTSLGTSAGIPLVHYTATSLGTCNGCHAQSSMASTQTSLGTASALSFEHYTLAGTCDTCHQADGTPTETALGSAAGIPLSHSSTVLACEECHQPGSTASSSTSLGTAAGISMDHYTTVSTGCTECHAQGSTETSQTPLGSAVALPFNHYDLVPEVETSGCDSCHQQETISTQTSLGTAPGISIVHGSTTNTNMGACAGCHNQESQTASSIWLNPSHLTSFSSTCISSECHGAASQSGMPFLTVSSTCDDCHNTPADAALVVGMTTDRGWYREGEGVTYQFTVKNEGTLSLRDAIPVVEGCEPTLASGDTNGNDLLDPEETWIFTCTVHELAEGVEVTGTYMGLMEIKGQAETPLYPFTVEKNVQTYSGTDISWSGSFTVKVYKMNDTTYEFLASYPVSETSPLDLWLTEGVYKFEEANLPQGFLPQNAMAGIEVPDSSSIEFTNVVWYGCSPGYWKNHVSEWPNGYASNIKLSEILDNAGSYERKTLIQALSLKGGTSINGAKEILLRAGIASLLNELAYGDDYPPYDNSEVLISTVDTTLNQNRASMISLASTLDSWNNGYCAPVVRQTVTSILVT